MVQVYIEKQYWSDRYGAGRTSGCGSEGVEAEWKREVVRFLIETHSAKSILDIGCGDGQLMFPILSERDDLDYLGIDIAEPIIQSHLNNPPSTGSKIRFSCMDACDGLGLNQSFDLVIMMDVLFHVRSDIRHLRIMESFYTSFNKVGLISYWNKEALGADRADHCFYREVFVPEGFKFASLGVPGVKIKEVAVITHDLGLSTVGDDCDDPTDRYK